MERMGRSERWEGQVDLGVPISRIDVLDFLDMGGSIKRADLEQAIEKLEIEEPNPHPGFADDYDYDDEYTDDGEDIPPELPAPRATTRIEEFARSIRIRQLQIDKKVAELDREQRRQLAYLLTRAKEGGVRFWAKQGMVVSSSNRLEEMIAFAAENNDAAHLQVVGEFLTRGVFYPAGASQGSGTKNAETARVALAHFDRVTALHGKNSSNDAFASIEDFLGTNGTEAALDAYIHRVSWLTQELGNNHLRLRKEMFGILTHHVEHAEYREQLSTLTPEHITFYAQVIRKFIHPNAFEEKVGIREFLAVGAFIDRNKASFEDLASWEGSWQDLSKNLMTLFKYPSEALMSVNNNDLFFRHDGVQTPHANLLGQELTRQFPEIEALCHRFGIDTSTLSEEAGSVFSDILMKFSYTTARERYFIHGGRSIFSEPEDLFARFAMLGNFAQRIAANESQLQLLQENINVGSLSDILFVGTLLQEDEPSYAHRIQQLKEFLGEKISPSNNVHYYLLHEKKMHRWSRSEEDIPTLEMITDVMGKERVMPFTPQNMITNVGSGVASRPAHYGVASYFGVRSDYRGEGTDEQRSYLGELHSWYAGLGEWEGHRTLLEQSNSDGLFEPPHEGNLYCAQRIQKYYELTDQGRARFNVVLGVPTYDFDNQDFTVMLHAAAGNLDHVFNWFSQNMSTEKDYFDTIKQLLPEGAESTLKDAAEKYFRKKSREIGTYDRSDKKYPSHQINSITKHHRALLEHIYGEESDELRTLIGHHLQDLDSPDIDIRWGESSTHGPQPALAYAISHRSEAWVDRELCNRLLGNGYYDMYHAKDFVFEQRVQRTGITKENSLIAWYLKYDQHTNYDFKYHQELAELMNGDEARTTILDEIKKLFLLPRNDEAHLFENTLREELQSLVYLEPHYIEKILPGLDLKKARSNFMQPFHRGARNEKIQSIELLNMRTSTLLQLEYLLAPEDRPLLYEAINHGLMTRAQEYMDTRSSESVHNLLEFIEQSPFDLAWIHADALKSADFAFNRDNTGERFTMHYKNTLPLQMNHDTWASLLNLLTYQRDTTLEGYAELKAFILDPATLETINAFAKERLFAYLEGTHTLTTQEKILVGYLTDFYRNQYANELPTLVQYANQIEFLKNYKGQDKAPVAVALKKCLDISDPEAYQLSMSVVTQVAEYVRKTSAQENTAAGINEICTFLLGRDMNTFLDMMRGTDPLPTEQLTKKVEFMSLVNIYSVIIKKLLGDPIPLAQSFQFLRDVLKNSRESIKQLRFLHTMEEPYLQIVRETLTHSPKDFKDMVNLLNHAKTVGLPISEQFAEFVSRLSTFSAERLIKIHAVVNQDAITAQQEAAKSRLQRSIERVQRRLEIEHSDAAEQRLEALMQELAMEPTEKNHFSDLIERLEKTRQQGGDTRTEAALTQEVKTYLTPILIQFFEKNVITKVAEMIKRDFEITTLSFDTIDWNDFTPAYHMYKRLVQNDAAEAGKARGIIARCLRGDTEVWASFAKNKNWVDEHIPQAQRSTFMSPNKREYEVGNLADADIDGQIAHYASEAHRCLTTLSELTQLDSPVPSETNVRALIDTYKSLRQKTWDEEQQAVFTDLKVQIDALEQLSTIRHTRGTLPNRIVIEREIDPIKILQMGTVVQGSCLSADGINYWSAFTNAIEANKCVFWIKDDRGNLLGRVLSAVDDDNKMVRFPVYYTGFAPLNANIFFNQYLRDFAETYNLGLKGDKNAVTNLVMGDWYKDPEVEVD